MFVLLLPSVTVGSVGWSTHVVPLTKNLYCTGLLKGTLTLTFQSDPTLVIGSPLDHRMTFDSFLVGPSNEMPHKAAMRVAMRRVAEAMAEIGWSTRFQDLTEAQVLTLIEVAVDGFQEAMAASATRCDPEVPF